MDLEVGGQRRDYLLKQHAYLVKAFYIGISGEISLWMAWREVGKPLVESGKVFCSKEDTTCELLALERIRVPRYVFLHKRGQVNTRVSVHNMGGLKP